ncbi:MAG: hypothetical protein J2P31_05060, partial [Blastocatellia bacterium]|nr:hypothetical protein [Blastocatellia bacterium]
MRKDDGDFSVTYTNGIQPQIINSSRRSALPHCGVLTRYFFVSRRFRFRFCFPAPLGDPPYHISQTDSMRYGYDYPLLPVAHTVS